MIPLYKCFITDGTTVINLIDNTSYGIEAFDPVPAARQRSQLASGGPYQLVAQPVTVTIIGGTQVTCYDNLTRLITLLDQAENWYRDVPVSAVRLVIQTYQNAPEVYRYILGQVGDDDPFASVEATYDTSVPGGRYIIGGVTLNLQCTGAWEADIEGNAGSSVVTTPAVMTATLTSSNNNYSRMRVTLVKDNLGNDGAIRQNNYATILFASTAAKLAVVDSASFSTPAGTSNVADAGNDPLGTTVKRLQASTTERSISVSGAPSGQRRFGIYAAVRNNSASATFYLRGEVTDGEDTPIRTPYYTVDTSTTLPRIVYLGQVNSRYDQAPAVTTRIYWSASVTDAAQTLDIDYVVIQCLDDPWTDRAIVTGNALSSAGDLNTLLIEPGSSALRTPAPLVFGSFAGAPHTEPYAGDAYLVCTGSTVACVILTTNGNAVWRLQDAGLTTTNRLLVRRSQAYRTPPGVGQP